MARYPVDEASRNRLCAAQKAETEALRAVDVTLRARERLQVNVNRADAAVASAKVALVRVSGAWRAAQLLGEDVKDLRRLARDAGLSSDQAR